MPKATKSSKRRVAVERPLALAIQSFRSSDYVGVLNSQTTATFTGYNATNPLGNTVLFSRAGHVAKLFMKYKFT